MGILIAQNDEKNHETTFEGRQKIDLRCTFSIKVSPSEVISEIEHDLS